MEEPVVCVPLSVDAFVLNPALFASERKSKICPLNLPDYSGLRYGSLLKADVIPSVQLHAASPVEVNTRITDVAGTGKPRPDRMGVYLHWVLPRGFRTGIAASYSARDDYDKQRAEGGFPKEGENSDNNGEPEFRPVPDRWFVFRYITEATVSSDGTAATEVEAPILRSFVVESNSVREIEDFGPTEDVETEAAPFLDNGKRTGEQGATFLGQKFDLEDWNPVRHGRHHSPLTVVTTSNPFFPDYQPHNAHVFSLHDDLTYIGNDFNLKTLSSAKVSYLIFGFYANNLQDPFYLDRGLTGVATPLHQTILENCFMELQNASTEFAQNWLTKQATTSRLVCHGALHDITWSLSKVPDVVPAEIIAQRFEDEHPLAIGADIMDAVEAYLDSYQKTDDQSTSADELTDTMADITALIRKNKRDIHACREEAKELFRNRFKPTAGGIVWRFSNTEKGGNDGTAESKPLEAGLLMKTEKIQPTDAEKKAIHELNVKQHYMDTCVRHRDHLQFLLFCEWWKYRAEQETVFTQSMMRKEQEEKRARVAEIKNTVRGLMYELRILGIGDVNKKYVGGRLIGLKNDIKANPLIASKLKATLQATFYARKDPAVVIIGIDNPWPEDFSKSNLKVRLSKQLPLTEKKSDEAAFTKWTTIPKEKQGDITGLQHFLKGLIEQQPGSLDKLISVPNNKRRWLEAWKFLHIKKLIDKAPPALSGTLKSLFAEWMFFTSNSYADLYENPEFKYFRKPRPSAASQDITIKWNNTQGWFPLFIEWEAEYYHIPFDKWTLKKEMDGTIIYAISDGLNLHEVKGIKSDRRVVRGRSLLLPQVSETIENQIRRLFDNVKKGQEVLNDEIKERILRDIARLPLLSSKLEGLTDHLLTFVGGTHVSPSHGDLEPRDVDVSVEGVFDADVMDYLTNATFDVTPYGRYLDFQRVRTQSKERRFPFKPVTHGQVRLTKFNIIDKFGQVVCALPAERGREFIPLLPHTSKSLSCQANSSAGPYFANTVLQDLEGQCQFIQLSPAINQDSRINACFVLRDEGKREANPDPQSINFWINRMFADRQTLWRPCGEWDNPIWGWLLVNYRDGGLQIYEGDGTFRAEALLREDRVFWRPKDAATFLGDDEADDGEDDDEHDRRPPTTQLDFLLQRLKNHIYLQTLMSLIKDSLRVLSPVPGSYADQLPAILGRPLALVNTGWSLELATPPMVDESYQPERKVQPGASQPSQQAQLSQPTLLEYEFDLKLGDKNNSSDGVIGFFLQHPVNLPENTKSTVADPYQMDYDSICSEFLEPIHPPMVLRNAEHLTCLSSLPKMRPYYINPTHHTPEDFRYLHDSMLQVFGMIIDPFSSITGYSGILPPKQLQLPPWTVEEAMKKMKPMIRIGPVLIPGSLPDTGDMQIAQVGKPEDPKAPTPGQAGDGTEATPGIPAHVPSDGDWIWLQPRPLGGETDDVEYVEIPLTQYQTGYIPTEGPHTAIEGFLQLKSIAGKGK